MNLGCKTSRAVLIVLRVLLEFLNDVVEKYQSVYRLPGQTPAAARHVLVILLTVTCRTNLIKLINGQIILFAL